MWQPVSKTNSKYDLYHKFNSKMVYNPNKSLNNSHILKDNIYFLVLFFIDQPVNP